MSDTSVGEIGFTLSFDGSKMMSSINSACTKLKTSFETSFNQSGESAKKTIETTNKDIQSILSDTSRTAKSKATAIAWIYRKEGDSMADAMKKAWSHIERDSSSSTSKVKKHISGIRKTSQKTVRGMEDDFGNGFNRISGLAKKAGAALAGAFAAKKLVDFGKKCLDLGSDLEEVQNVVDVTFPRMTAEIDKFAKSAAQSFGLSETMAKQYTGTFGAMAKAFGFTESEAYDMSTTLTGLAGDVASFYNLSQDEAYTKLKSVFTGETETLKDLGVVMTQSALDAYALANGYGKTTQAMSEMEKVALRYQFVQDKLSAAQGDFARTSDSWANQCKILSLQVQSIMATIGQGLINLFTPIIKIVNTVIGKIATLANAFKAFTELITGKKSSGNSTANVISEVSGAADTATGGLTDASAAADGLSDATNGVGSAAKKAVKQMRALMGFDKINRLDSQSNSQDSGSGGSTSGGGVLLGASVDFGSLASGETVIEGVDSKFKKLFENLKSNLAPLSKQLERFGKIAKSAFSWLLDNVLKPLANFTINEVVPRFFQTLANVLEIINNVLIALQPLWQWFWDNLLRPIASWTGGIFLKIWDGINGTLKSFADWCAKNPEIVQNMAIVIASFFAAFKVTELISGVMQMIAGFGGIVGAVSKIGGLIGTVLNPWTLAIGAVIAAGILLWKNWDVISEKASEIWGAIQATLSRAWDNIKRNSKQIWDGICNFISKAWSFLGNTANTIFSGISTAISNIWGNVKTNTSQMWQTIKTGLSNTWEGIKKAATLAFEGVRDTVSGIWTSIKTTTSSVWNGIKTSVSGVWDNMVSAASQAGAGIKSAFSSAFKSLVSIIKTPVNGVIALFNGLIKAVNSLLATIESHLKFDFTIPNPLGGTIVDYHWKATLPRIKYSIPALAQGGFVAKNTPQLALIGDNRHQGEVVAPEDKLQRMVDEAVARAGSGGISKADLESILNRAVLRLIAAMSSMGFNLDGEQLATLQRMVQTGIDRRYNTVSIS